MKKLIAALACRNNGSRLYGKPLQNLDIHKDVKIIDNIVACLQSFEEISEVLLGVSLGAENHDFIDYAKSNNLGFVIGDEKDVLSRLIQCGEHANATDILRVTSESPFAYHNLFRDAWDRHVANESDATFLDDIIDGCGFEILNLQALKTSHAKGEDRHRSEFCTLYIRENKDAFEIDYLIPPEVLKRKDIRLTVDYPEDLIVCRAVYEAFKHQFPCIDLTEVVEFLDENPDLKKLTEPFCKVGYTTMYL